MGSRGQRVVGIDVARFVALAGMMAIHILPAYDGREVTLSQSVAGGRASGLFAVLAGVSLTLTTGRRPVAAREWAPAAAGIAVRAGLIALLGLVLGELDTGIAVILTYYGVLFVLGIPFLVLRTRALFALAGIWLMVAPVASLAIRPSLPPRQGPSPSFEMLAVPVTMLEELLWTGYYPAFVWLAYLLAGMGIGRLRVDRWQVIAALSVVGAGLVSTAYVVSDALLGLDGARERLAEGAGGSPELLDLELAGGMHGTTPTNTPWWLAVRTAHTGTTFDLMHTIGSALVVIAVCLVVGKLIPRASAVVFGAGAMTLTLYSLHVVSRSRGLWDGETTEVYVGQVAVALAIGMGFGLMRSRGPLEWIVGLSSRLARRPWTEEFRWGITT